MRAATVAIETKATIPVSADFTTHGVGRIVGPYRLEEEIGRGGMGVVYRARRLDTGEVVAVKLMLPEISANHRFRARFVREASLGSDLDHPNIVPIYDAGEADGELFIAMRLVAGRDLKALIEEMGPLDPKRVIKIMRQVANALDAAHEAGVVHNDVKPQNILIADRDGPGDDLVFVTDFGLVRPAGAESTASRTGQVFGSIQYMPPEQVEGMPADGRADVYSLGCVLFECLTGEIPFERPNEVAVLWAHVHEEPGRVTDRRAELPGGLDAVVATAMAKHPDDRFLTCGELLEALEKGVKQKRRPVVMPAVRPLVKRIPRPKTEREVWAPNFFPELSRVRKMTNKTNWFRVIAITGTLCLLAVGLVEVGHPRGISGAATDVAGTVGDTVQAAGDAISSALEGEEGKQSDRSARRGVARIDSSGRNAFTNGGTGVDSRRSSADEDIAAAAAAGGNKAGVSPNHPVLSRSMTFVSSRQGSFDVFTSRAGGTGVRQVTSGKASDFDPVFSPNGSRIAFARGAYREGVIDCPTGPCPYESHIFVMNADGSDVTQLSTGSGVYDRDPTWSPNGRSLVFTRWTENQNADLYILTQGDDGSWTQSVLTDSRGSEAEASFSPDGTRILYSGDVDRDTTWTDDEPHNWDIFVLHVDGGLRRLTRNARAGTPEWSPDSTRIAFAGRNGVFVMRADGSGIRRLTKGHDYYVDWAPDGIRLAFERCGDLLEKCRVMTYDFRSARTKLVVDDVGDYDGMPGWAPV
ncbi:MAG: serine/threonine-protein kinase [Actinomycetota bacterium]|nr:serine/threonine-protein kinase [Actinomycetota bacterium]